jgi:hypothetical protein
MGTTTLRYYSQTVSYQDHKRLNRIDEMKKRFRTRVSRRRTKQALKTTLHRLRLG